MRSRDTIAASWADSGLDRLLGWREGFALATAACAVIWATVAFVNWMLPVGGTA